MNLKEITKGTPLQGVALLVEKRDDAVAKNGKTYLKLKLCNATGSLEGRLWNYQDSTHGFVKEGAAIEVFGMVEEFNGTLQLNIQDIHPSLEKTDNLSKRTRFNVDQMWSDLVEIVGSFQEPLTKFVAEEILTKHGSFVEAYKRAPAAKTVHNNWFGGLIEHVHSLCTMADPIIRHYQTKYCPKLSRDKVLFGLMMHDAGKIIEYDYTKPSFNLTGIGVFTNHIVIGPAWVYETANRFPEKSGNFKLERAHLMHVLAAHHGQEEWGSPVKPSSLEALLVHHLDNLDSKMMHALDLIEGRAGSIPGFSEKSYFERTQYYRYE